MRRVSGSETDCRTLKNHAFISAVPFCVAPPPLTHRLSILQRGQTGSKNPALHLWQRVRFIIERAHEQRVCNGEGGALRRPPQLTNRVRHAVASRLHEILEPQRLHVTDTRLSELTLWFTADLCSNITIGGQNKWKSLNGS